MQRIGAEYPVVDERGNGIAGATVTIYTAGASTPLPVVYAATGSALTPSATTNPITTDSLGRWQVALPDGRYDIVISGTGITSYTIPNVCVFDNTVTYPSPALGTVTSVGMTVPSIMSVSGSPVTSSGTLAVSMAAASGTGVAGKFLGTPSGGGLGTIALRIIALNDLPSFGPTASTTFGSATKASVVTTNGQGIITSISESTVTPAWSSVTGKPSTVVATALTDQVACVFRQTTTVTVGNTTTETTLIGAGAGSATLAANQLVAGSTVRVKIAGYSQWASGTLTIKLKLGANTVITTGAVAFGTAWAASQPTMLELVYTTRTTGAGGTGIGQVIMHSLNGASGVTQSLPYAMTGTSTVDTTASNAVDVTIQWGTAAATNTMTVTNLQIFLEG